jgi:Thioredoxin
MAVTRERFEQGMSYDQYKAQMTRNRERFEENERTLALSAEEVQFFKGLPQQLHVLVLAEDWCGDVINNLPVLGRLAEASGKLNVRVFLRDQNLDLIDQYLNQGLHRSIPVFAFFDEDFRDLGHWIERPAAISARRDVAMAALYAEAPELQGVARDASPAQMPEAARNRIMQFYGAFRAEHRAESDAEVVRELRELVAAGLKQ